MLPWGVEDHVIYDTGLWNAQTSFTAKIFIGTIGTMVDSTEYTTVQFQ